MKKEASVVMLPTDKASCLYKTDEGTLMFNPKGIPTHATMMGAKGQNLYFINDEKIKEGDWYIESDNFFNNPIQASKDDLVVIKDNKHHFNKIIATTDPELTIKVSASGVTENARNLSGDALMPRPSQAFIEEYCRKGGIDEVDVEYEEKSRGAFFIKIWNEPKVNSDNTITIHPIIEHGQNT